MKKSKFYVSRTSAWIISLVILATLVVSGGTIGNASGAQYDYARALQYSLLFYDSNMCGTGVAENSLYSWRNNCHVYDAKLPLDSTNTNMSDSFINRNRSVLDPNGTGTIDVAGGFHDAGDHVKFGMPQAYSASTLGWGFYEFRDSFEATGQAAHMKRILRYFNDYFMKTTFLDSSGKMVAFCYQVGDGDVDHRYWNAPENDTMERKGWFATSELPSTDVVAAAAASLAANYMNFKDEDPQYAQKNLQYAKAMFDFAYSNSKQVNRDGPKIYYNSSKWEDDYCWAAAWLYLATQDDFYLDELFKLYDYYAPPWWTHCWNDVWVGTASILAQINDLYDKNSQNFEDRFKRAANRNPYEEIDFWSQVALLVENWMNGRTVTITPGGYAFLDQWGSARYNTATQLAALVYDKHNSGGRPSKYSEWARSQMNYLMGNNPRNLSYIVGYNNNSVKFPHHRAASGTTHAEDPSTHKHVLYGALVGGPGRNDEHIDVTHDYIYNEVAIDYNAAFVGACAGLYEFFGDSSMSVTPNFPPNARTINDNNNTNPTIIYGDLNGDGRVDSIDIVLLRRYILEIINGFSVPKEAADLNGDGVIDSTDYIILRRYLLEIISSFPVNR
ncbi:UNVERIFIED_CONTAM: dockerin type I repeat protein [Acetivibrio alkalicellulosi]